jgi:hypothetical protein
MKLYLKTLRNTPCLFSDMMGHSTQQRHFLFGDLQYELTKPAIMNNKFGVKTLFFYLLDDGEMIGNYHILEEDFDLIELYNKKGEKISLQIWQEQNSVVSSSSNS